MPNHLIHESSPYLLQHAQNPVDWYPWGPEALTKSRQEDKPIFLSIGYSACHWCHVMEHESFENEQIAQFLNQHFVSIKVDREERPDLDQIYMTAVQLITGRGGWPMSVFLTPDLEPFYGGTYWPPAARMGMPGFDQVLAAVIDTWQNRRNEAEKQAGALTSHIRQLGPEASNQQKLPRDLLRKSARDLAGSFDPDYGGFGGAPKFPHPMSLQVLMRAACHHGTEELRDVVRVSLDRMASGGIYDHLGGGFARYSVDQRWLVPHFEKMLYDNALLADAYLDGALALGNAEYAQVARETLDYVLTDMTDPAGGFHSTEDADSEGVEGKFYVWTRDEIEAVLGAEQAGRFCFVYGVTNEGNFEGKNILQLPRTVQKSAELKGWDPRELQEELAGARAKLLEVRQRRVRPGKDDKVLASWNGLMIQAMARAAGILEDDRYLQAATRAAEFVLSEMRGNDGRLLHTWRHGSAKLDAYLDDYATLANALVSLYEASFDESWIDRAVELVETMLRDFRDAGQGGFYFTSSHHEELISRTKDIYDDATPSGNAMAATALVRLGKLTGQAEYLQAADEILNLGRNMMEHTPMAAAQLLIALDLREGPTYEVVLIGGSSDSTNKTLLRQLRGSYLPNCVVAYRCRKSAYQSAHLEGLFAGKQLEGDQPTAFLCEGFRCQEPAVGEQAILETWQTLGCAQRQS
jgi:uncharacterized protein YyaL (SSP411 family)